MAGLMLFSDSRVAGHKSWTILLVESLTSALCLSLPRAVAVGGLVPRPFSSGHRARSHVGVVVKSLRRNIAVCRQVRVDTNPLQGGSGKSPCPQFITPIQHCCVAIVAIDIVRHHVIAAPVDLPRPGLSTHHPNVAR
ncbi:hypothetical protein B0H16DRAFT_1544258 [Mycena metata]|uniref:Uncharacterized protein n=1 Tax=Mycena metata TaxID=1033252 RepID=A0AAD7J1Y6_9AGAR|nr:hypothetical protein B0H16DRAFT_1544258 [Mycena metata]